MNNDSENEAPPPQDELQALRARVAELEASQIKESEIKELTEEVRSSGKGVSRTIIVVVVALIFGSIIGNLLRSPPPSETELTCAKYNIRC